MNYWQLLRCALDYGLSTYQQWRFMRTFLHPVVDRICLEEGYVLSPKERKKVRFYYPMFNQLVNCENYLAIRGRTTCVNERMRLALISAMATLFDDLVDEEHCGQATIDLLLAKILPQESQSAKMRLFTRVNDEIRNYWEPTEAYLQAMRVAMDWQVVSANQLEASITLGEVLATSKAKCGTSSLAWAASMDQEWTVEEKAFIYQSGYVGQLVNDLFDAYKDREDGVYTFVRKSSSIQEAKELFLAECALLNRLILKCPVPLGHRTRAVNRFASIHAFGLVALEHLQNTEHRYTRPMDWSLPTRKELVTDMALWPNRWLLLKSARLLAGL